MIRKTNSPTLTILPFQPETQTVVKALILASLVEHWGMLDSSKNPDLDDIAVTYADGLFLVAWQDGRVIGTGALVPRSKDTAEIVRMSVAAHARRQGVGSQILHELSECSKSRGYKRLILETTAAWDEVIDFYQRFGFHITHHLDGDVYFALDI